MVERSDYPSVTPESAPLARRVAGIVWRIAALAAMYFLTGKLGLELAFENENATAVWPPTGIALAALLLLGRDLWPGVAIGAFAVNITTSGSAAASLGIVLGNTLEIVVGAWLVQRFAGGRAVFEKARTTFSFILFALLSALLAATIGVTSLGLMNELPWSTAPTVWLTWWIGDAVSAVMLTPLIMMWASSPRPDLRPRALEAVALFGLLGLAAVLVFGGLLPPRFTRFENSFVFIPPLLWAAFRFGQRGAVTAAGGLSGVAIAGTLSGFGPFVLDSPNDSLLLLQTFLATITATNLALGAVVSEGRRSAEALLRSDDHARQQHLQLQGVMQAVPAAIWIAHDIECRLITGNPASYDVLRMPSGGNASLSNRTAADAVAFEVFQDGQKLSAAQMPVQRAAAGETIRDFEEEIRYADGSSRYLFGNATPLLDKHGVARGAVAAFVDITERKQAERRLAANLAIAQLLIEARAPGETMPAVLRTICETLGWSVGAIWTPAADGQSLRCQYFWHDPSIQVPQFEAISRKTSFAPGIGLPGRVWQSLTPVWIADVTQDANFPRAPYAIVEGLHGAFGFPIISSGYLVAVIEFFSRAIREPDRRMLAMFAGVGAQIGQYLERRRAEAGLRASQQQLQLVTDCMSAPVSRCTRDMRYAWVSKPYADWCGRIAEEIIGRPIAEILGAATFARLRPYFERVLAGETVRYEEQVEVPGRGLRWISAVYSPTSDPAGNVDGWVAVVLDIDDRKRSEETLRDADRRKDEFLAILAHELRNPLAPMRNALALLERGTPGGAAAADARGVIERQVGQLERLLDDLLDVGRITSGKLRLLRRPIQLTEVLEAALESSRGLIEARNHSLQVELPREPVPLDGDLVRLSQVFANLLQNAAKYTPPGGRIELTAARNGSQAVIRVRDNGIGIPREKLARVFEMFVQIDNSLERTGGGLGIGLSLATRLVELHDGRIVAQSEGEGRGSEFIVYLPLQALDNGDSHGKEEQQTGASRPRLRILVADDNLDGAATLVQLLELMGHTTRLAHDGHTALSELNSFVPDAAILDIGMPGLNGYEVARRARESEQLRHVYLIALTGWGQESDKTLARAAGFDAHLTKPARIEAIEELLMIRQRAGSGGDGQAAQKKSPQGKSNPCLQDENLMS